jgi:hypothetical protein
MIGRIDPVNDAAFKEAYKDLVNMRDRYAQPAGTRGDLPSGAPPVRKLAPAPRAS